MCGIRLLLAATLLGYCSTARLDSTYLPPGGANGAGGNGNGGPRPGGGNGNGGGGSAAGANADAQATIISYENDNDGSGNYKWSYETSNGIKADETGELKNAGSDDEAQSAVGSFSYTAPDGTEIKIEYTADENGFVPKGDHLPTPPPIPPEILKSLEENAAEEAAGGGNGGGNGGNGNGGNGANGYRY
ncbi:pupal cuticle protein 20-like isoform X2 [Anthonomus grandis grandis]|uniref:pupal cuticle protein 20-like isoform X2 n=1 Tax=Anthonomus grandis grandis TaxID=2921223 RepID=UPI002164F376|nr:pupal cuticle protein 20-like isoform X2 [Anthonomus grandis grandis]